jgi:hypothetical protein
MAKKRSKTAIFSFVRLSKNSMVASVRIAYWLQEQLGCDMTWEGDIADLLPETLIIVNGAYGFSKFLEPLSRAILAAKYVVWVQNDYTIIPPKTDGDAESPFRKAFVTRKEKGQPDTIFWSTCEKWYERKGSHYVNWNQLTFDESYDPKIITKRRKTASDTLFYYGSYRDGSGKSSRVPIFDRYFTGPFVQTVVSSPVDKFEKRYPNITTVGAITDSFYAVLASHGLGLYIEDRKSSEEFHSPANRFYEMLSAGLPMVFMPESGSMMRKAGFNPEPYYVHKAKDVKRLMANREDIGEQQRKDWIQPDGTIFRANLLKQLSAARRDIGL